MTCWRQRPDFPNISPHAYIARTSPGDRWSASLGGERGLLVGKSFETVEEAVEALRQVAKK